MPESKFELAHHFSQRSTARSMISMSAVIPSFFTRHPEPISLGIGEPHHTAQPISSMKLKTHNDRELLIPKKDLEPKSVSTSTALKYGSMQGLKGLWTNIREFIEEVGDTPAFPEWGLHPTFGRSNGFHRLCETFLDEGDVVLTDEFTSNRFIEQIHDVGAHPVSIRFSADNGIDQAELSNLLAHWEVLYPGLRKPKMIYMMPAGAHPSGVTQPFSTKREIYDLCNEHDLLIIEDDSSSYISLNHTTIKTTKEYLKSLGPSYQTMDSIGRVIRLESFSKTFGPGLGLGYLIAHQAIIKRLESYSEIVNDAPAGPAQALVNATVCGMEGWVSWMMSLSNKYIRRKQVVMYMLEEKSKVVVIDPLFGVSVGIQIPSGCEKVVAACEEKGLSIDVVHSLIDSNTIIKIALYAGNDEEFKEAMQRLVSVL